MFDAGLEGFFRQIPVGLILMFCGSGILLVGALSYAIYSRRQRSERAAAPGGQAPGGQAPAPGMANGAVSAPYPIAQRSDPAMFPPNPIPPSDASDPPYPADFDDDLPDIEALSQPSLPTATRQPAMVDAAPPVYAPITPDVTVPAAPRPTTAYTLTLTDGETTDAVEVMTVLRDIADGTLIIQIGDRAHRFPLVDADADFSRRVQGAVRALVSSPSAPAYSPPPSAAPSMPPVASAPITPGAAPGAAPGDLPKFRLEDLPPATTRRNRNAPKVHIPQINIGGAIETYLQHKRAANGDFPDRSIHVRSGMGGSIVIEVDGQFFESVGEVSDPAIRAYLQETIAEWQSRQ